jgi:oxygen-dependent protoporphyrinogen oxidase
MEPIVVVGAGISGLAVALEVRERASVVCLEASPHAGGNVRTDRVDGFLCEWGANGFLDDAPATLDLVRKLGLEPRLVRPAAEAAARFVFRAGRLRKLPSGLASFLGSGTLSPGGRLRVLTEPFRAARAGAAEESVFDFAARRLGLEAAEILVDAMITGIHAGDPRRLSIAATFPRLPEMERAHGSLVRGLLASARAKRREGTPRARLTSFPEGMGELTGALARAVGPSLVLGARVARIEERSGGGHRVHLAEGAPIDACAVVLACPASSAAELVRPLDGEMATAMERIPYAAIAVVHAGFDARDLTERPRGFGFLVPRGQGPRVLGTIWASSVFPGRAPEGGVLLTTMLGGARDPAAAGLADADLVSIVREDLRAAMGIEAPPRFVRIYRHPRGIPQYEVGHLDLVAKLDDRLRSHPGLFVAGCSYRGVSVNACVEDARTVASGVLRHVAAGARS